MQAEVQYSHNVKDQIPSSTFIGILHFALGAFHGQKPGEAMVPSHVSQTGYGVKSVVREAMKYEVLDGLPY